MYDQSIPNKNRMSNSLVEIGMTKRPGRKKRIGSIMLIKDGVKYFGGYCRACDQPHYLTPEQLAEMKVYYGKSRKSIKARIIRMLQD